MSVLARLRRKGPNEHSYYSTAEEVTTGLDLSGRTLLITGCSSGLGHETLRVCASRGARVIATARTLGKAEAACRAYPGEHLPLSCDLSHPDSIRSCIEAVIADGCQLDAVIANAGVMALPHLERARGYELQFFVNHVGHHWLVTRLLERLAPTGRVVIVSSNAHHRAPRGGIDFENLDGRRSYGPWKAYGRSKLANLLFAKSLARRLPEGQTANAVHPGVIRTRLMRNLPWPARAGLALAEPLLLKSVPQGAATQTFVATQPNLLTTGAYFANVAVATPSRLSRDAVLGERLWHVTEDIIRGS